MALFPLLASGTFPDPAADAVVLAASVVATIALIFHAIRQPGPHRAVYAAVALATAGARSVRAKQPNARNGLPHSRPRWDDSSRMRFVRIVTSTKVQQEGVVSR